MFLTLEWRFGAAFALLVSLACSGCSSVPLSGSLPLSASETPAAAEEESQAISHCHVELREGKQSEDLAVPIDAESRVQDVLDATQATKKFRNLEVVLLRPTSNPSEPTLKLTCRFDRRSRKIGWESDYAVLPGDRVVVREDSSSRFDQFVGSLLGPVFGSRK